MLVKNFQHDGSWDYQNPPPGTEAGSDMEGYMWWNSKGIDASGCKTEHLTSVSTVVASFLQPAELGNISSVGFLTLILSTPFLAFRRIPAPTLQLSSKAARVATLVISTSTM